MPEESSRIVYCTRCRRKNPIPAGRRPVDLRCQNCGFIFLAKSEADGVVQIEPIHTLKPPGPPPPRRLADASGRRRRFLVPEVVQTSAMDCGPASLKCLLEGFGISVGYDRLRDACQTELDGTSIDTIEQVAVSLGLQAEQIMLPLDHLLLAEARALPAIVVVCTPNGVTHFVVAWQRHRQFLQVMDPATGRRWPSCRRFLDEVYVHAMRVQASAWRKWVASDEFTHGLHRRLTNLGLGDRKADQRIERALGDPGWRSMASLDAATRTVDSLVRSGGVPRGNQTGNLLDAFLARAEREPAEATETIPAAYWSVQSAGMGEEADEQLLFRGAVLLRARGLRAKQADPARAEASKLLSGERIAALAEPRSRPGRKLLGLLRADGLLAPTVLAAALALASAGVVVEGLLFRGLFELGRQLGLSGQRLGAMAALAIFAMGLLILELPLIAGMLRMGRRLEARLRVGFLGKIPLLGDRYFQSRLSSDMAERCHTVHKLRLLPDLGGNLVRSFFELALTTAGIVWLEPASAPVAVLAGVMAITVPTLAQPLLVERDMRRRTHSGALSRFYLDALLGLVAIRTHGAEQAVRREHESLLVEWVRAGLGLQRAVIVFEAVHAAAGFGLAAWLLLTHLAQGGEGGLVLLLVYWALNLPVLGQEVAALAWQYPAYRNVALRLLEPLEAPGEDDDRQELLTQTPTSTAYAGEESPRAVRVALDRVSVRVAGHTILESVELVIEAGTHVAIVGPSGAGKSTLVGLLLGWHRPAPGQVTIDGVTLDSRRLDELRRETAWVDPTVQLWNQSLLKNLCYGATNAAPPLANVIEQAELLAVLEKLPDGLQTSLGEAGALVSGGEGQRVRFGRALQRSKARLVILDEPFRGLDRELRQKLLGRARRFWKNSTLLCITHDVGETRSFDRVLVMEMGSIIEDGAPADLLAKPGSRFGEFLATEETAQQALCSSATWRRLRLAEGELLEAERAPENRWAISRP